MQQVLGQLKYIGKCNMSWASLKTSLDVTSLGLVEIHR